MSRILVTGANGFIGSALCSELSRRGWDVTATIKSSDGLHRLASGCSSVLVKPLQPDTQWEDTLRGIDVVVHLAARVHVMRETATNPLEQFLNTNAVATRCLAVAARAAGVRRLVFLSSVGVNGNVTTLDSPFTEHDNVAPHNDYCRSKHEAELLLRGLASGTSFEIVTLRAPLVYGPDNPGNFLRLLNLVHSRLPLPFASVKNRRSMIFRENLVDAIITCCSSTAAANRLFLVSDGEDISTPELLRKIGVHMGRTPLLMPFSPRILSSVATLTGVGQAMGSLIGTLTVDTSRIRAELGWQAPYGMNEGLERTVAWYLASRGGKR